MTQPQRITSRQNPRVKAAAGLRNARERRRTGRFIIDGIREITRGLDAGIQPLEAFVCDELCGKPEVRLAVERLESSNTELFQVSADVFAKLAFGDRLDGIVVIAADPSRGLTDLRLPEEPVVAILEALEKPGNVGAILRSADAAGIDAVIVADGRTDLYNPNTIRASLGTVFRANVCAATTVETIAWIQSIQLPIVVARPDAETLYNDVDYRIGAAIVLGSEAAGLSDAWSTGNVRSVCLPMHGIADSLNVSTTAAVLFYEALRQRA